MSGAKPNSKLIEKVGVVSGQMKSVEVMITALEKHRRTAQHSTERRGQTITALYMCTYIYIAGNLATNYTNVCTFKVVFLSCVCEVITKS